MNKYHDKVTVICLDCKTKQENKMYYGESKKYPDDFYMKCTDCNNWEEGSAPPQSFDILEEHGRYETKE
ncbi:hypothetical protein bcgnr5372_37330 [Bacillus luti]|nr:hypothetical protein [Bacillus cereus]HDR8330041.1 hypothetical protein [Bacillus cereus]HDR8337263.1 hypothetical protein [Bacillus cereus]